jgi:hypothetical protein
MTRILAALLLTAAPAAAQTALGLSGDRTLVMIDPATAAVTGTVEAQVEGRLLGIDWRPATGQVIGVTEGHAIVAIDPMTGAAIELSRMATMLPVREGQPVVVDFNPAADRLRFMTGTANHRVNVDTGEVTVDGSLAYLQGDASAEADPMIGAAAYINSYGKPETTAMFNIDTGLSALVQQAPPNDGTLATIGALGVMLEGPVGFDVATDAGGTNTAWLAAGGALHTVDLGTGRVLESWTLTGADTALRDLTVLPAM